MSVLAVALFSTLGLAKDKGPCGYTKVEEDKFTHATTSRLWDAFPIPGPNAPLGFEVTTVDKTAKLRVMLSQHQLHREILPVGYELSVLMTDGTVIPLKTLAESHPVAASQVSQASVEEYTTWTLEFSLDANTVAALGAQNVTAIRATLPDGVLTWESAGDVKWLNHGLVCAASLTK